MCQTEAGEVMTVEPGSNRRVDRLGWSTKGKLDSAKKANHLEQTEGKETGIWRNK